MTEIVNKKTGDTHFHNVVRTGLQATRDFCESPIFTKEVLEVSNNLRQRPLHLAVAAQDEYLVEYLLQKGAEVDAFKKGDWTSLMVACTFKKHESIYIVQLLLKYGANHSLKNKDGWTSMHLACKAGYIETVELLASIDPGLIWKPSRNGRVSLHIAALNSHYEVASFLIKVGRKDLCNIQDACGTTPVLDAVVSGHLDTLKLMMCHVDVSKHHDFLGHNCLHKAAQMGHTHILKYLLQNSTLYVNEQTISEGFSPLHYAVMENHLEIITELLRWEPDFNLCNKNGETVFNMRRGMPSTELKILIKAGINNFQ